MKHRGLTMASLFAATLLSGFFSVAQATTLSFYCITGNIAGDCAIGEAQLTVDVTSFGLGTGANGGDEVLFTFMNSGFDQATISAIYFDNGTLLGISQVINSAGVAFSQLATPPDLPGGETLSPAFDVTAGFSADANNPAPSNGVNPGESVGIVFELLGVGDLDLVLLELASGEIRIGLHVINFASGGSESFVTMHEGFPPSVIPVPAAAWLFGSGLLGLVAIGRRRSLV